MQTQHASKVYPDLAHYSALCELGRELEPEYVELLEESLASARAQNRAWHLLLNTCQGDPVGLELKSRHEQYALILPDASEPGRFRAQMFDAKGFFAHSTRDTALEVLELLVTEGYTELATGALEQLSQSTDWKLGMFQTNLIAEVNRGRLSYPAMLKRLAGGESEISV